MLEVDNKQEYKSKILGENIKNIRKNLNYTQEEFSEKVGITPQFLSSVERGVQGISLNTALNICKNADCSLSLLFKDIVKPSTIADKFDLLNERDKNVISKMIDCLLETK